MKADLAQKRGQFIGKVNSLLQEFHFVSTESKLKLIDTFASSFYGSSLWDLTSNEADKLYRSWNVTVRNVLDLDRRTHRFLIEPLSGHLHLKTILLSRLVSFHKSLVNSHKFTIRFLARLIERDLRTVHGKTLNWLLGQCNLEDIDDLSSNLVKRHVLYCSRNEETDWKTSIASELYRVKKKEKEVEGFSDSEINDIFLHICTE